MGIQLQDNLKAPQQIAVKPASAWEKSPRAGKSWNDMFQE